MRKIGLLLIGAAISLAVFMAPALADPPVGGPPGQGECEHGNSGQTCVPDPQPEHGQECEEHGPNEGGVNEDHCLSTTTTTTVSPTVTETETTTTSTTTTTVSEVPPSETLPTTTTSVSTQPTTTVSSSPIGTVTSTDATTVSKTDSPKDEGKLAFTGVEDVVPLGAAALTLLSLGSGLMWAGSKRTKDAE